MRLDCEAIKRKSSSLLPIATDPPSSRAVEYSYAGARIVRIYCDTSEDGQGSAVLKAERYYLRSFSEGLALRAREHSLNPEIWYSTLVFESKYNELQAATRRLADARVRLTIIGPDIATLDYSQVGRFKEDLRSGAVKGLSCRQLLLPSWSWLSCSGENGKRERPLHGQAPERVAHGRLR